VRGLAKASMSAKHGAVVTAATLFVSSGTPAPSARQAQPNFSLLI